MGSIVSSLVGGGPAEAAEDSSAGGITAIHSNNRWLLHFNACKGTNQLMVVDFAATWCGPCKMMEPVVNDMAARFSDVSFCKVDVDAVPDVAREYAVQAMPTFLLLKEGKEVDRVIGAKKDELERKIGKHRSS